MTFKTWINDLRDVQSVINNISNTRVIIDGVTGLLNTNSLKEMSSAVSGLSKEQALLILSTKNLNAAQQEQVLLAAGIISSENSITASAISQALAKTQLSATEKEALLTKLGLIDATTGEAIANATCTKEELLKVLATKGIIGADADAIVSSIGLTSANSAQAISFDLLTASIWANIKALGKWLITNPVGWAILGGTAIFGLVKAYDALTDSVEEVKERTENLLESYNSAISEANSNAKTIESLADRYETLSKGVNNLGENVSLTSDEYSEYNDIVNQIADMFPTLITGYTDEGNAILSLKGNVEKLRDAYKEVQTEAYNLLIVSGKDSDGNDIIANYKNQINGKELSLSKTSSYIDGEGGAKDAIDIITKLTGALTPDEFRETYNQLYEEYKNIWNSDKIQDALKSSGFEALSHAPKWGELTGDDLASVKSTAQATIQTYKAEIDSQLKNIDTLANAYLMTNEDYSKLDDQSKTAASLIVNSITEDIANGFSSKEDVGAYVADVVSQLKDNPDLSDAMIGLFTTDLSDMSVDDAKDIVDQYINTIAKILDENPVELKVRLGFDDYNDNDIKPLKTKVQGFLKDEFDDKVGELSLDDLQVASKLEIPEGTLLSWDELKQKIEETKNTASEENPISFGINSDNVSTTMQGLEKIKSLYTQFAKAKEQLSSDSSTKLSFEIQDIEGIKDSLMDANKQLLVSEEEFSNFETILADQSSTAQQIQDAFDSLATAYVNNALEQGNYTDETKELIKTQLELQGATAESADAFVEQQVKISEAYKAIQDAGFTAINIPSEEITKMEQLGIVTAETAEQMRLLAIQEQIKNGTTLNTATDCQNLLALASDAGLTTEVIQKLIQLIDIYTSVESNAYGQGTQDRAMALEKARQLTNEISDLITNGSEKTKLDLTNMVGGKSGAGSAGKEAADAYLEAFEKELGDLDDLKDRGIISEKEYLDRLRELYQRYFKDKEKYVDQYQKYEKKYLDGMYSLYNSAISGITKLMGKQIDGYSEEKESAVSALEEERDARLAVIDAQKEQFQSQIDLIEKQIDEKQKEIDAINDAADARKRELDLQKAQYELERARNQRTILQYSEEKGMHYVKDDSAERDAKENVDDAKREIQIAAIQKEIDLLNEQKDAIQEQIDLLDKQSDQIEEYYSKMIESTEKYYDSLIKSMENQKSKWEELADIKEVADAYSAVQQVFGDLGYTVEDVLSGNEQAFEDFRNKYIALMNDMNSNSSFGDGLSYATGKAKEDLGSFLDSTNEVADGLDNLSEKSSAVDGVATSLGNASTSASELSTNTNGLSDNLNGISDSLNNFPTEDKFSGLTTQFTELGKAIGEVAKALGIDGEGSVNSLVTALSGISEISLGDEQTGVIAQFNALASAVNAVSSAINGTGGGASSDPQDSKSQSMSAGATGTSGSITSALDELKSKADEVLGTGGGEDSGGEGTIGQFEQLEQAVKDVSTAIGSGGGEGEESGRKSNGEEDADNLIGAITSLGEQSEETLGESGGEGVIGRFEQFRDVIGEANEHVTGISDGLDAIDGKEVECTITVNIKQNGDLPAGFGAWTGTAMNLESGSYNAKYGKGLVDGTAHVEGTAKVTGDWGVHQGGQALLGELGREIIVRNGRFFTVGENGAEMHNLQPGDIVFNHVQTEELLKNGHISSRGKAYADGTVNKPSVLDRLRAQGYEVQKYEWKDMYGNLISPQQMNEAAKAWVSGTYECLTPMNDFKEKIKETVKIIEGANVVNNTMNQQPISVTMGDIHLHEVQDVDGLSKAIIYQMPGKMLQAIHQK